jgi:hypothetical protein
LNNVEDFQPTIVQLLGPKLTFDSREVTLGSL